MEVGYLKGSFDCMWNLADGMSWMSLHYLANEIVNRKLIQTNSPFEHIKKYIHYASTYPLEDQFFKPAIDKFSETDDEKIFKQECDLINSALDNIEPNKAINYGE